jgi:hypothetical protein
VSRQYCEPVRPRKESFPELHRALPRFRRDLPKKKALPWRKARSHVTAPPGTHDFVLFHLAYAETFFVLLSAEDKPLTNSAG